MSFSGQHIRGGSLTAGAGEPEVLEWAFVSEYGRSGLEYERIDSEGLVSEASSSELQEGSVSAYSEGLESVAWQTHDEFEEECGFLASGCHTPPIIEAGPVAAGTEVDTPPVEALQAQLSGGIKWHEVTEVSAEGPNQPAPAAGELSKRQRKCLAQRQHRQTSPWPAARQAKAALGAGQAQEQRAEGDFADSGSAFSSSEVGQQNKDELKSEGSQQSVSGGAGSSPDLLAAVIVPDTGGASSSSDFTLADAADLVRRLQAFGLDHTANIVEAGNLGEQAGDIMIASLQKEPFF